MIIRENVIEVEGYDEIDMLEVNGEKCKPEELIFFDLEHYVYKKPKCIGVFGACIYNNIDKKLYVTQYMIENKGEVVDILVLAKKYFLKMREIGKKSIVTFSGNNDYTVINYLFKKYNINFNRVMKNMKKFSRLLRKISIDHLDYMSSSIDYSLLNIFLLQ